MKIMYSPSTQGFYPFNEEDQQAYVDAGSLPDDLVVMDEQLYVDFFNPPPGKYGTWVDGVPVILVIPALDYLPINNATRDALIAEANAVTYPYSLKMQMGRTLKEAEKVIVNAWMDYTDALGELTDEDLSKEEVDWPVKPA